MYMPKAMHQGAASVNSPHQVITAHWYIVKSLVEDLSWRAVRYHNVHIRNVWDWRDCNVLGVGWACGIVSVFISLVWEGPAAELGLVGRRVDLLTGTLALLFSIRTRAF